MIDDSMIDNLFEENRLLIKFLTDKGEISFSLQVERDFTKSFLLACASFFETSITLIIEEMYLTHSKSLFLHSFTKKKAIERQYHTYFDWKATNANTFFSLFGEEFKTEATKHVNSSQSFKESMESFIMIGSIRNKLVHQNYAQFVIDKTPDEIYELFKKALIFVIYCRDILCVKESGSPELRTT